MSIAEAVAAAADARYCKFGAVLNALDNTDQQAILDGLAGGLTYVDAARILIANGHDIGEKAIRVHRANECRCPS